MPKQQKGLSEKEKEKIIANEIDRTLSDNLAVRADNSVSSDNNIPKLNKYTHTVNNDASVGLNGVPGQHEVSNTTGGNAFLEGMTNLVTNAANTVGQGVNKLAQAVADTRLGKALLASGSSDWVSDDMRNNPVQALKDQEEANRAAINEYQDYRNTLKEEHPIAFGVGDFLTKSQLYRGAGALGAATGAEEALAGKIGDLGANLALGQAADVAIDTVPTEIENYQNGMRGKELAIDTAKNFGTNALYNLGAEGLQRLPGLIKGGINALNGRNTAEAAQEIAETAAKSAPTDALKQLEPTTPVKEINPVDLAANNSEVEELAYKQQREAADAINNLRQQIPSQSVSNVTNTGNRSALQEITDSIINTRNTENLVGNGNSEVGRAYLKNIDKLQNQEKDILKQAEKITNDPALEQLKDEVVKTSDAYWNTIQRVDSPINPEAVNIHRQALENLENYMKDMPQTPEAPVKYGKDLKRYAKELEMPDDLRNVVDTRIKDLDGFTDRIRNAKSKEEVEGILREAENMVKDTDNQLMKQASYRTVEKYDLDNETKTLAQSLDKRKIYISPELREEFRGSTLKDLESRLYFNSNEGRMKPKLLANSKNGTSLDKLFPEIDREAGGAISNYMKNNGLNPEVAQDQLRGMLEYADSLKAKQSSAKLRPYEGGMLDEAVGNIRKTAEDKISYLDKTGLKQLDKVEPIKPDQIPNVKDNKLKLNLQYFSDEARKLEKDIEAMEEGEQKNTLRKALQDFWNRIRGAKTEEEAEEAWNALSKTRTNTIARSNDFTDFERENIFKTEDARYLTEAETIPYEAAEKAYQKNPKAMIKRYTQKFKTDKDAREALGSSQDVNGMYIALQDLTKRARETEDITARNNLYSQARQISRNLYKTNRELGRGVQANAKFTRTPERAIINAEGFAENAVEKALDKNPNLKKGIEEVSDQINNFLKDMDVSAMKREEIEDMINQALLKNKRVKSRIGKGDVTKIADAILNDKQYTDIQKTLEFLSTGFGEIDADTMAKVHKIFDDAQALNFNSKKRVDMENEAYKLLAEKIAPNGGSFRDKVDAWRYLAMLANPTTHMKNITGNLLFGKGMVSAKNTLAAMIEEGADRVSKLAGKGGIERTKSILTPKDAGLIAAAKNDGLENAWRDLAGNKYFDAGEEIDKAIPAFSNKNKLGRGINKASEINSNALSSEDEFAVLDKYKTSLAGFLKANGADESIFKATDKKSEDLLNSARAYAINQAQEAAFHQDSDTAKLMSQFSRTARESGSAPAKAMGFIGDVVVPFKKTPINIVKSVYQYSPLSLATVAKDIPKLNSGAIKPAEFIDHISRTATGTGALAIGWLLSKEGILKVGADKSDQEESFDKQTGRQNVAIKVGDKYTGVSELIPAAAPLIWGATIRETLEAEKGKEDAANIFFSGLGAIANGVTDMTMLSGIADTLNSIRYAEDKSDIWEKLAIDTTGNAASQMLPTLGRKINVTADDTRRSTYSDKTGAAKMIDQETKYLQTKIPGLQQAGEAMKKSDNATIKKIGNRLALQPDIDVKGQVRESQGVYGKNDIVGRAIGNFISPAQLTKDESTKYDEERRRLAKLPGNEKVLPYIASSEAKISDDKKLTPEEWTEYRKQRGQLREKLAEGIIDDSSYKSLSDADKAELLKAADDFSKNYSQSKYGKEMNSSTQKYADIYEKEGIKGFVDTVRAKTLTSDAENSKQETKLAEVRKLSKEDQKRLLPKVISSKTEQKRWDSVNGNVDKYWQSYDQYRKEELDKENRKRTEEYKKQAAAQKTLSAAKIDMAKGKEIQQELASYGANDSIKTVEKYAYAKQTIPSLSPKEYAGYVQSMSRGDGDISQTDIIKYANQNNFSQKEMDKYWKAFTNTKKIPKLSKKGNWYVR